MALPDLDERGLLPPGIHQAEPHDVLALAYNDRRNVLSGGLLRFIRQELAPWAGGLALDLGGSYFSDKPEPDDIEATLRVPLARLIQHHAPVCAIGDMDAHHRILQAYGVDFYVTIEELGNDFSSFFQYVGPKAAALKNLLPRDLRGIVRMLI